MRRVMIAAALTIAGTVAGAGAVGADTLEHVIAKGIVLEVEGGIEIPVTYAEDGTYVADVFGEQYPGVWRIEGENVLCTRAEIEPEESCVEYPAGKRPGDAFEMSSAAGTATVHIND